jgi:1-aminocyclopropane-1-carboxylate deaminase/D-cysteine desulfhydrase-like pyridoxal-dependent ACC family enzyme
MRRAAEVAQELSDAPVDRIARFTATAIGLKRDLRDDDVLLDDRYHAGTYGIPTPRDSTRCASPQCVLEPVQLRFGQR